MGQITSLKPQKDKKRVNIYIDDKFAVGIDLETLVKLGLKVGDELSSDELEKIVRKADFGKIYSNLIRFVTLRPRSTKEVNEWFRRKTVSLEFQDKLLKKIKKLSLLDDTKFARWWVNQRQAFKPRSKRLLKLELQQKGIEREIIEETLSASEVDDKKYAFELAYKKKNWDRNKLVGYLSRKGFTWDTIDAVLKEVLK